MHNTTNRLAQLNEEKMKKQEKPGKESEPSAAGDKQLNKSTRLVKDGLLLVVTARINGHPVCALINSNATRCFVTASYVIAVGLKGQPQDTFLELGNDQKFLSRGLVPNVPVVIAGLTMRVGLTVTSLLHEVGLVLGVNWRQLVNPVVDWSSGKVYLPNAVHTALLQGDWLEGHVKAVTMTVLAGEEQLKAMNESEDKNKIAILKCPKFWKVVEDTTNSWTNSFEGHVSWGYLYKDKCELCNLKNGCKDFCKHRSRCKLYSIVNDKGKEVVKMKRVNKNTKLSG